MHLKKSKGVDSSINGLNPRKNEDKLNYKEQCRLVKDLIAETKKKYYNNKIMSTKGDQKQLFKIINSVFHNKKESQLPSRDSTKDLTNDFSDYFIDKITSLGSRFTASNNYTAHHSDHDCDFSGANTLSNFKLTTCDEIAKLIKSSPNKSSMLDPIPTWLVKKCTSALVPFITAMVNLSLSSFDMPYELKRAILTPFMIGITLDHKVFNNFRPISNIALLTKIIEKVVADRLNIHMLENHIHEVYQSSYKKLHSTETALTSVLDDILRAVDDKNNVILLMLDLSSAFDTLDHSILLNRYESMLGIKRTALEWFKSYLSDRNQYVCIDNVYSKSCKIKCSVPQGSVLGPLLSNIYTLPLGNIIKKHGIRYPIYADDSQKYAFFNLQDYASTVKEMETLVSDIRQWYDENLLMCNVPKTEVLLISSMYKPLSCTIPISVGNCVITPSAHVKDLGVILDKHLSMETHVNNTVKNAFLKIREISYYRKYLTEESAKTLMHAYVTSRVDYCNGLLYGLSNNLLRKLQSVLNTAARVVTMTRKYDSITPVLKRLHWLPVKFRVQFKLLLLVFKSLNGLAPSYLRDKLILKPSNNLRSSHQMLLIIPNTKSNHYGDRCFSVAGRKLCNSLPKHLRTCASIHSFKGGLKTHLFKSAFN